jgi:ribonuclease BN (tRNA processing enzyme)
VKELFMSANIGIIVKKKISELTFFLSFQRTYLLRIGFKYGLVIFTERHRKGDIMSQKITFYPLGNAESVLLELSNGKIVLFDFADTHTDEANDKRIDLAKELGDKKSFDVVIFSHPHNDHVKGAKDFFEFDHAKKYQDGNRAKMAELWISSAFVLDSDLDSEDARVIRQEARFRLKNGYGIKVFSEPNKLCKLFKDYDLSTEDSSHPVFHAGTLLDSSTHDLGDEVQFFVHAPFSEDSEDVDDKNEPSIVMQVRLFNRGRETNIFMTGDTPHDVLDKIINRSESNDNEEYLKWDIYDVPHHCSYTGLNDEKGDYRTTPKNEFERLLSDYSQNGAVMIASCKTIAENTDDNQPPHIEAKRAYEHFSGYKGFLATMEYPSKSNPKPLRYLIDSFGIQVSPIPTGTLVRSPAPRAGL